MPCVVCHLDKKALLELSMNLILFLLKCKILKPENINSP